MRSKIGHYMIVDGFVQMCDEVGRLTGKEVALNGEDPAKVAGRLTREAWTKRSMESNFNRRRWCTGRLASLSSLALYRRRHWI